MSRFNEITAKVLPAKVINKAGGEAYVQTPELELVSILLTSFATDQYYEKASEAFDRLKKLVAQCDPKFVAQAAIYARTVYGMRSITHVVASELARFASAKDWSKSFYDKIIFRPDDMSEILAYHTKKNGKITNAMKKGFASAFNRFNGYSLAKYRGEGKEFKLVDILNLVHPKAGKYSEDIKHLINGTLKSTETWESQLSKAGQVGENDEDKLKLKGDAWRSLIKEKKLGYLALLRNLRNIMEQAPDVLPEALAGLTDETWITNPKNLIFPFQYLTAYKQFAALGTKESRLITQALSTAIDISCQNVKTLGFEGNTLVVVDNSGSMESPVSTSKHMNKSELGGLFGIILAKAINADLMEFGTYARYINFNLNDHSMDFAAKFPKLNQVGHGTDFHSIFKTANKKYDRILIFSDMQGWIGYYSPKVSFDTYKRQHGANPFVYSFDLAGLGTMQLSENRVFALAGFSEKIFDTMKQMETDKKALINEIKKIEL